MSLIKTSRNRLLIPSIALILIVTLTPGDGKFAGIYLDKLAHFLIFLFLGVNLCFKFTGTKYLLPFLLEGVLFGVLTEVLQQYIPGRNYEINDIIADTLGVGFGYFTYKLYKGKTDNFLMRLGA